MLGLTRDEGRLLALMGGLVAILLCAYTIAKVLRDSLFLQEYGALSLPYAYVGVALASAGYLWIESRVARHLSQVASSRLHQIIAIAISIAAALALPHARHATAAVYYLWTGSQAMLLIPYFWALALDVWDSRRARVLFPVLSGCGLVGGLAGGGLAASLARVAHHVGLMWIVSGLLAIACGLTAWIDRYRAGAPRLASPGKPSSRSTWAILRESGYVKVLTVALALSVVVGTLVDFQFKLLAQQLYPEKHQLTQFLGTFYAGLNAISLVFQFGVAGWLLQSVGLRASTVLQPGAVLVFAVWASIGPGAWVVITLRWIQGVVSQTLGKTSTEIYYAAIEPRERRRIKPAMDTLTERWSDALVGVLLAVVLHLMHAPVKTIAAVTGVLAAAWFGVLIVLDRRYGQAFLEGLSRRYLGPDSARELVRLPSSRRALRAALASDDSRQVVLALALIREAKDAATQRAVVACLRHPDAAVRTAAVEAMTAMRLPDPERIIEGFLRGPDEGTSRAAIRYLLSRGEVPLELARGVLDGGDRALRDHLLDALADYPAEARRLMGWDWIDARIASGGHEELLLAARAAGAMDGPGGAERLRTLLASGDVEVVRIALSSAARRPDPASLDVLLPLLRSSSVGFEAAEAIAAVGDPAVPRLLALLGAPHDEAAARAARAARALGRIGTPRALTGLTELVRGSDAGLRHLALDALWRLRVRSGRSVLPRSLVHRTFLRELREYRIWSEPVAALENHPAPEARLLRESYRESAERALERALEALACWYDPKPLPAVFEKLKSRDSADGAPALEYLGHVLPRRVFRPVSRIFEKESMKPPDPSQDDRLADWIRLAWDTGDAWLRACAVRASRLVPGFDRGVFAGGDGGEPIVRAELDALAGASR